MVDDDSQLKLCLQLLNSSGFEAWSKTKSLRTKNENIVIELSNGYDITFNFANSDGDFDDNLFYVKEGNRVTYIDNVSVTGFYNPKLSHLNQKQLLSLFKNLALHHSKLLAKSKSTKRTTNNPLGNIFPTEGDGRVLESIYKLAESLDSQIVDVEVLRKGIHQFISSSSDVLDQGTEETIINSGGFKKKILFKDNSDEFDECLLFNLQRGTPVSIVYDMLSLVYLVTDQEQRQKYFHEITEHYYNTLKDNLDDVDEDMPLALYKKRINTLIPYVKLALLCFHVKQLLEEMKANNEEDIVDKLKPNNLRKLMNELILEMQEHILVPQFNREDCFEIVEGAMGSNYEKLGYELAKLDGVMGLLGEYYKLKIIVTQKGKERVLHLFAKLVPVEFDMVKEVYLREEFFYTTFVSEVRKIGLGDITNFLPKCYFVRQAELLVFEDLSHSNYRSLRCEEAFSYDMLRLVVKQFAKMHSCSLLYEETMTKKLGRKYRIGDRYMDYVREMMYVKNKDKFGEIIFNCGVSTTVNFVFDQFQDVSKDISMETFRERTTKLFELMVEKFEDSKGYRKVICHGDIWGGNIMFKFDEERVTECRFVDFQLIRYSPPCHDLLAFLYINTDKATRTKYMSKLLDQYYDELSAIFKKYDFDLNKIYPYQDYVDCCDYIKSQAICLAALTYPNSLDREKIQDMSPTEKLNFMTVDKIGVLREMMKDNRIRARFKEIVEDLYQLCLENNLDIV